METALWLALAVAFVVLIMQQVRSVRAAIALGATATSPVVLLRVAMIVALTGLAGVVVWDQLTR